MQGLSVPSETLYRCLFKLLMVDPRTLFSDSEGGYCNLFSVKPGV